MKGPSSSKKLFEESPLNSVMVPIAVVLIGAAIIFGVTKLISTDRTHRDLIREMQNKTFGNRWIAAFELAKYLSSNKIENSEVPWIVENLSDIYKSSNDARTRDFVVR